MGNQDKIKALCQKGVIIPDINNIYISEDVDISKIESGVTLFPGVSLEGKNTQLGQGTSLGREYGGKYIDVRCGRNVSLGSGVYQDCVFLNYVEVRSGAEMRGGTLFMEHARAAHTVGCKMTILGMYTTLGSLINYCDIFVSGGDGNSYNFSEIGSGAVHYNFTPDGFKFGSLIGPGVLGEICGMFPRVFIGGQTQIIAPTKIGSGSIIPAGVSVREVVADNTMYIAPSLKAGHKKYCASLITQPTKKFMITAELIVHYSLLAKWIRLVRKQSALQQKDAFLATLYEEAALMAEKNAQERVKWLFTKKDKTQDISFFSKLNSSSAKHSELYQKSHGHKVCFHLEHIEEHQNLIDKKDLLFENIHRMIKEDFVVPHCQEISVKLGNASYSDFIMALDQNIKNTWRNTMGNSIASSLHVLDIILQNNCSPHPDTIAIKKSCEAFEFCIDAWNLLQEQGKIIADLQQNSKKVSILNSFTIDCYTDIRATAKSLHISQISKEVFAQMLSAIVKISYPVVIDWHLFVKFVTEGNVEDIPLFVKKSIFRLHGTDGIRGNVHCPHFSISYAEAIQCYIQKGEMTPELCTLLAHASIAAFEKLSGQNAIVAIAKDTRNIYKDTIKSDCLYKALTKGSKASTTELHDFGTMPIANVPYLLSYFVKSSQGSINLFLYKSASHNPASQDGLKIFLRGHCGNYSKASLEMEQTITAIMFSCSLHSICLTPKTTTLLATEIGEKVFHDVVTSPQNLPAIENAQLVHVVGDLSHGALAASNYFSSLDAAMHKLGVANSTWVGANPDGKNINNNIGDDRVGAGHFESVEIISRKDILAGGKYYGFSALQKLFTCKENKKQYSFAIFMDGDGDRGITMCYNPYHDLAYVLDGDKSLFIQTYLAVQNESLQLGDVIAFTVDSSVPFMNEMKKCIESKYPVEFIMSDEVPIATNKINLKVTPIGDKYILKEQCFGGEKSGHIISLTHIKAKNEESFQAYVGNGFLANINTVAAASYILAHENEEKAYHHISALYPEPKSTTIYAYFINKELWYRGSHIWNKIDTLLHDALFHHENAQFQLLSTSFAQEPDTMFYCSQNNTGDIQFSILARPSGTENKISVKFSGTKENISLFSEISEKVFYIIAHEMKNNELKAARQEQSILELLQQNPSLNIEKVKTQIGVGENAVENSNFATVIEALAKQKLISYDGVSISITPRGKKYIEST